MLIQYVFPYAVSVWEPQCENIWAILTIPQTSSNIMSMISFYNESAEHGGSCCTSEVLMSAPHCLLNADAQRLQLVGCPHHSSFSGSRVYFVVLWLGKQHRCWNLDAQIQSALLSTPTPSEYSSKGLHRVGWNARFTLDRAASRFVGAHSLAAPVEGNVDPRRQVVGNHRAKSLLDVALGPCGLVFQI